MPKQYYYYFKESGSDYSPQGFGTMLAHQIAAISPDFVLNVEYKSELKLLLFDVKLKNGKALPFHIREQLAEKFMNAYDELLRSSQDYKVGLADDDFDFLKVTNPFYHLPASE